MGGQRNEIPFVLRSGAAASRRAAGVRLRPSMNPHVTARPSRREAMLRSSGQAAIPLLDSLVASAGIGCFASPSAIREPNQRCSSTPAAGPIASLWVEQKTARIQSLPFSVIWTHSGRHTTGIFQKITRPSCPSNDSGARAWPWRNRQVWPSRLWRSPPPACRRASWHLKRRVLPEPWSNRPSPREPPS